MRAPILRLGLGGRGLIVDSFAGGGGTSTGIEGALGRSPDFAINHDPKALAMHRANHPDTTHAEAEIWNVDLRDMCGGQPVALAWYSPACTHFSQAKGAANPLCARIRGLPWVVVRDARRVRSAVIVVENVREMMTWGPLGPDGRPIAAHAGETWRAWLGALSDLGYVVDARELTAADYGAPTTRRRLFVIARCDGRPIVWPEPTHGPGRGLPHQAASKIIRWDIECPSIFERARPLADATHRRIAAGLKRFVLDAAAPFLVKYHGGAGHRAERVLSIHAPLRTIDTANRFALVSPFVAPLTHHGGAGTGRGERGRSLEEPLPTVTGANRGELALIAPALVQTGYGEREGQRPRALDIGAPLGTVVACGQKHALVAAFLSKHFGGVVGHGLERSIGTVTARDHHALTVAGLEPVVLAPFVSKFYGTSTGSSLEEPLPTVTAGGGRGGGHLAEVAAFLIRYNGAGGRPDQHAGLDQPLGTVVTRDRFAIVMVEGVPHAIVDIGMRMLAPEELFGAQGFPADYQIRPIGPNGKPLTKTDQIHMCGNSVPPPLARAIVEANAA